MTSVKGGPSGDPGCSFETFLVGKGNGYCVKEEWGTPPDLFHALSKEFGGFDLDPAAADWNAKCGDYYTRREDGLVQRWYGNVWLNPPYGRGKIELWMKRAFDEVQRSAVDQVVALVPARTDGGWFHDYIYNKATEIRFLRGRLYFIQPDGSSGRSPWGSMVVVWGDRE